MQKIMNYIRNMPTYWIGSKSMLLPWLMLSGLLFASDESGTFGTVTKLMTFYVAAPCSIMVYLDITPRIECFYKEELPDNYLQAEVIFRHDRRGHEITQDIFNLINVERTKKCLRPLAWREDVYQMATSHSTDMYRRNYFAHESPDGLKPKDRFLAANIEFSSCGECIYMTNYCGDSPAKRIVDGWMDSPGHRAIILEKDFTEGAVGIYSTKNHIWITFDCTRQDFE